MSSILDKDLQQYRLRMDNIIKELHQLTIDIKNEELSDTVSDLRSRIIEPYMFVIVGEVKAGKSSFINALLGSGEICKVAPDPCTDTIQQILYGEEQEVLAINEYLKRISIPVDILKDIAIVDTPGTNTISQHHQEITERFIPASDLIIFVFEAKNPYRQSAWDFFDYIHSDWQKKIIFVLQQADLMEPEDLKINIQGVHKHAIKKGIENPQVFSVSAKMELEGKHDTSNFAVIRDYVTEHITGGKAPKLKLKNNIQTSQNINERINKSLSLRQSQYEADLNFREDVKETLISQEKRSNNQVDLLSENLLTEYDKITTKTEKELSSGLNFFNMAGRTFMSMFSKKQSAKEWFAGLAKNLERDLNHSLYEKLNTGVVDLAESIQQMARVIDLKIRNSESILKNSDEIFGDIAHRRSSVLRDLQEQFAEFLKKTENFTDANVFPDQNTVAPNIATGSGIAAVGIILAAVANGAVFDITGGILTAVGLLFAGITVTFKRRQIVKAYRKEINSGRDELSREVSHGLKAYVSNIKTKIEGNFQEFDQLLLLEGKQLQTFSKRFEVIFQELEKFDKELDAL